jgi:hypothetical protein
MTPAVRSKRKVEVVSQKSVETLHLNLKTCLTFLSQVYTELLTAVSNSSTDTFALQYTIFSLLQDQPVFPIINQGLALLATGNSSAFGGGGSLTIDDVVGIPYLCNDYRKYMSGNFLNRYQC